MKTPAHKLPIGHKFTARVALQNEAGEQIPAGTLLRLVAVVPKVYRRPVEDKTRQDGLPVFANLVRAEQTHDYGSTRVRCHFAAISAV